jgi:integrase
VGKYKAFKVKTAEYVGDRKVSGLRSVDSVEHRINALLDYFGDIKLRSITPGVISTFKSECLKVKTRNGQQRSIAAVNRELEVLRAMMRYAKAEGWIDRTPFEMASETLISKADEGKRDRILSRDEEIKLLNVCTKEREHLRPLVIAALDTGCRKGELLSLEWKDIDLEHRVIRIRAMTTKTLTERIVPISDRLPLELQSLKDQFPTRDRVFGISVKFQHSWETACRLAELNNLRFHDLRATFCTRLIEAGLSIEMVAKISGHTQLETLYKHYLRRNQATLDKAVGVLNQLNGTNRGNDKQKGAQTFIN